MRPFDISQDEYEVELRKLEDLLEEVGGQTTPTVTADRVVLLRLIIDVYGHAIATYENYTGREWEARPIVIKQPPARRVTYPFG